MRVLILGGTGTISSAVVPAALAAGHEVTVLNRGSRPGATPPGVIELVADAHDEAAVSAALAGREFDTVAQFVAFTPDQVERDLRVLDGRCGQYVFISSASTYLKPLPSPVVTEDSPLGNPFSAYAREKIACEEVLRGSASVPWTIVRPSHTYSERAIPVNLRGRTGSWQVIQRLLDGLPVLVHGDGESLWTFTWNADFAAGFVGLFGHPDALGRAVHITSDESLTWNRAFTTIGEVIGVEPRLLHVASDTLARFDPEVVAGLQGDKSNTIIFDTTLIKTLVPGFSCPTAWADGVARAWDWISAHPEARRPDPAFDAFCDRVADAVGALGR